MNPYVTGSRQKAFLPGLSVPNFGIRTVLWALLGSFFIGCVSTTPTVTYQPFQEGTFTSRPQPSVLSQKTSETLIAEGFIKIGALNLHVLEKTCQHYFSGGSDIKDKCASFPHAEPIPLLLKKSQAMGGDLIVIEFEKPYTEIMNMMARDGYYAKEYSAITAAVWRKKS